MAQGGYAFLAEEEHRRAVPSELAAIPHWVTWDYEEATRKNGDSKPTKVLHNPHNGRKASSTDPSTWGTLEDAYKARQKYSHAGVGYVVTEEDRIVGIDLDHCIDPATGVLAPWAAEVIATLDSYAEVSPSGQGIRIFCRGTLPAGRRKRGNVEMYSWGRFLTVTGNRLDMAPDSIIERTDQIAAVHAQHLGSNEPIPFRSPGSNGHHKGTLPDPTNLTFTLNWNAVLTTRQFKALCDAHPKFKPTWDMDRKKEHPAWTVSEYQMALASIMAGLQCEPQQIADALVAHRLEREEDLKHQAYYDHTIRNAYVQLQQEEASARTATAALDAGTADTLPPDVRDQRIKDLATRLGFPLTGLLQYRTEPATYLLQTTLGDVQVPNTNALTSQRLFRNLVFEATRLWPIGVEKEEWDNICRVLAKICIVEEIPQGTMVSQVQDWLAGYLSENRPAQPGNDPEKVYPDEGIATRMRPYWKKGQVHIFLAAFKEWIKTHRGEQKTEQQLGTMLKRYGAQSYTQRFPRTGDTATTRLVWILPNKEESTDDSDSAQAD